MTWKKVHLVFNEALLMPYTLLEYPSQKKPEPPPPIIVDDEEEYEIKELMDSKFVQNKLKYLVNGGVTPTRPIGPGNQRTRTIKTSSMRTTPVHPDEWILDRSISEKK